MQRETKTIEFKRQLTDTFLKNSERTAFANCHGGQIFFGVDDDGTALGMENASNTMLAIENKSTWCVIVHSPAHVIPRLWHLLPFIDSLSSLQPWGHQ